MAQKKYTELPAASALDGSEILALVQGGSSKRATALQVKQYSDPFILASSTVNTAGATITLAFQNYLMYVFSGTASFGTPKTIAHSGDANALKYDLHFEITNVAAKLTFPAGYIMSDVRWEAVNPQEWEPADVGKYKATATYDGTNWWLEISAAPYV